MYRISGVDSRSLILFRQLIALLYIYTGVVLRFEFFDLYSIEYGPFSNGVMDVILNRPILTYLLSTDLQLKIFLVFTLIIGVLLFIGTLPSLMSFIAMFNYILLSRRFFAYFYGVDEIIISVLFILSLVLFVKADNEDVNKEISIAKNPFILLLLAQVVIIYWFNGINKTHISWWKGEAVSMASFNVFFNKPLALSFFDFNRLNTFLSYFTLFFELIFPALVFSVFKKDRLRLAAAIGIVLFHWGIHFFADVTLYKYTGIAFAVLLLPTSFWNKYPFLNRIILQPVYVKTFKKMEIKMTYLKIAAYCLTAFIFFKAINASLFKQNIRYHFIKDTKVLSVMEGITSSSYSPFRQYWFMFAPSPPMETGFIGFDYVGSGKPQNINLYGNKLPIKKFPYYHPFHLCIIVQFNAIVKGYVPKENEFVLFSLFEYYIKKDMALHPERKQEDYELAIYQQSYNEFKSTKKYKFKRKVLASYQ